MTIVHELATNERRAESQLTLRASADFRIRTIRI